MHAMAGWLTLFFPECHRGRRHPTQQKDGMTSYSSCLLWQFFVLFCFDVVIFLLQSKTAVARSTYEDTEHITRLRIGQDGDTSSVISAGSQYSSFLPTSDSMPLLAASVLASKLGSSSSRCPSSISMDQLSTMTAVTSFIDDTEDECESESGIACHNSGNDNSHRLNVQNLIVISNDPSPEVRRRRRSDTGTNNLESNGLLIILQIVHCMHFHYFPQY